MYSSSRDAIGYPHKELKWACCNCGQHAGMDTASTPGCPDCYHYRCDNCDVELVIRKRYKQPDPVCKSRPEKSQPASSTHKKHSSSHVSRKHQKTHAVDEGAAAKVGATAAIEKSSKSKSYVRHESTILVSLSVFSPASTEVSRQSEIFSPKQTFPESEAHTDISDISSEDETIDTDTAISYEHHAIRILESRLLTVLDHDLDLAARITPEVFRQTWAALRQDKNIPSIADACPQETEEYSNNQETYTAARPITTLANNTTTSGSQSQKRPRDSNGPDETGEQPDRRFKKSKPISGAITRNFACHYYKRDPIKYDPRNSRKYRSCPAPSVPTLRRIKDHFKGAHGPFHCGQCSMAFNKPEALMDHCKDQRSCTQIPLFQQDGFDDSLWKQIVEIVKAKRGLNTSDKLYHEIEKWYDIWHLLFPGIPEPSNPWNEIPSESLNRSYDIDTLLGIFERFIDYDIEEGTLRPDDRVHQLYVNAFRRCLEMQSSAFIDGSNSLEEPIIEPDSSGLNIQDRLVDSVELNAGHGMPPDEVVEPYSAEPGQSPCRYEDSDFLQSHIGFISNPQTTHFTMAILSNDSQFTEALENHINPSVLSSSDGRNHLSEGAFAEQELLPNNSYSIDYLYGQDLIEQFWNPGVDLGPNFSSDYLPD